MNWKIGTKLVCVNDTRWTISEKPKPVYGEIVTYDGHESESFVYLKEYKGKGDTIDGRICFRYECFRPLLGQSAKSELVSSFTEVTETSDLPIKQPENV